MKKRRRQKVMMHMSMMHMSKEIWAWIWNLDQMHLGDEELAAEPVAAPVVKPWEKALGIALRIPNPDEQRTMVDAAIAMRDASNRAEEEAKASRKHTSKKPPRSVALAPSKFTGQGKGQSFKVWCEGLKNYMDVKGQDSGTAIATAMTFLEGAPLTQAMVLAGQHVVWEWNAWVNAMQSALFQVDPTQEAREWIHAKVQANVGLPSGRTNVADPISRNPAFLATITAIQQANSDVVRRRRQLPTRLVRPPLFEG